MEPRDFQLAADKALLANQSTIIIAPTGLGKTRASTEPFVRAGGGPGGMGGRLLYVLPLRALTRGVRDELDELAAAYKREWRPVTHHGVEPESQLFSEVACITTVDQYFTAFAGVPLSFAASTGHAVAGALFTSYSVFDEAHLLAPQRGLPLLFAILRQRQRWGLLSTVMTATLPQSAVDYFRDNLGLQLIEPSNADVHARDGWRSLRLCYEERREAPDLSIEAMRGFEQYGRVIVFTNTVGRAIDCCKKLRAALGDDRVLLAHSRFVPSHRQQHEEVLRTRFGRDSTFEGILVTTQVAEAGLNISAPLAVSELCPADSIVQRAGRACRFASTATEQCGELRIFDPQGQNPHLPYDEELVKLTKVALKDINGSVLDWAAEKRLVNAALGAHYDSYLRTGNAPPRKPSRVRSDRFEKRQGLTVAEALGVYERAFRRRAPAEVERVLRDLVNVQIMVSDALETTRERLREGSDWPETVSMPYGTFLSEATRLQAYPLEGESQQRAVGGQPTRLALPGRTYVLLASEAGYDRELGLTLAGDGDATPWKTLPTAEQRERYQGRAQTFEAHARGVWQRGQRLSALYEPFVALWARRIFGPLSDLEVEGLAAALMEAVRVAALFHDVGKLGVEWQKAVGWQPGQALIARTATRGRAPKHAVYAYPFLAALLKQVFGQRRLAALLALAVAQHHSLSVTGTVEEGEFDCAPGTVEALVALARELTDDSVAAAIPQALDAVSRGSSADEPPGPSDDFYMLYCVAHRLAKLADWEDAGDQTIEMKGRET